MIKKTALFFVFFTFLLGLCQGQNVITVTQVEDMPRAVSGHYAGVFNGVLTTWGGCNFPDVPCAEGGKKVFYPKAYGASVTVPEGTVFIGGTSDNGSEAEVVLQKNLEEKSTHLPSLPKGLDNFAACYGTDRIFVAGGQTDGTPNKDVYALDWPDGKEWVKLCELPSLTPNPSPKGEEIGRASCRERVSVGV